MLAKSPMLYGFADEMEKIAKMGSKKAPAKQDPMEPNLNTFERHPKKILGGAAAAGVGALLLAKKLKKVKGPGVHIPKSVGEMVSDKSRHADFRKVVDRIKGMTSRRKQLGSGTGVKPSYQVHVNKKPSTEADIDRIMGQIHTEHGLPTYHISNKRNSYHSDHPHEGPYGTPKGKTKKAQAIDPMTAAAMIPAGIAAFKTGRGAAGHAGAITAPHGSKTRSEDIAKKIGYLTVPAGMIGGLALAKKKGLTEKAIHAVGRRWPHGLAFDRETEKSVIRGAVPALSAMAGGAAGGAATGLAVGGVARAKDKLK